MMGNVNWIQYKGRKILYADHTNLSEEEFMKTIDEAIQIMAKLPDGFALLDIADMTGTLITNTVRGKLREMAATRKRLKGATAVVGLSGFGKVVASLMNPGMKYVDSIDEAKEWLVQQ